MRLILTAATAFLLAVCGPALAESASTTQPAKKTPATASSAKPQVSATTKPSGAATTSKTASTRASTTARAKFPTPAELIEQIKQRKQEQDATPKVALFDLSRPVVEKPADFSLFGGDAGGPTLRTLLARLRQAKDDSQVRGVLITLGPATSMSLAQAQEIRDALLELRRADKRTFIYADAYETTSYTLATGATDICLLEGGQIMMPGVGGEAMFAKGLLDKIGVQADYVQIGEYKGADEQYTRTAPSEQLRGEMNRLFDAMYDQIVEGISVQRKLSKDAVKAVIDEALIDGRAAKKAGLVDHLLDQDGLRNLVKEQIGADVDLVHDYGRAKREEVDLSNPFALFQMMSKKPQVSTKDAVAVIYADGMIIDGRGGAGMFGGSSVGSDDIREAMRIAARDPKVKAVVVRIDSPGGSALASEVMWQAARRVSQDAKKPVIISIGGMAASGGYYLASAGDYIFADPAAVVGSIGVVGGKFVLKDLYEKVGLTTESFTRGRNADLFSSNQPFTDKQRELVTKWMRQTYDQFTDRIMTTRQGKIKDIDAVARGRIFLARQAKELGMVDELGGVQQATVYAANRAGLKPGEYDVRVLPPPRTFADMFAAGQDAEMPVESLVPGLGVRVSADSLFHALGPSAQRVLGQQIVMLQLLQQRPVALVAPFVVTVR